MKITIRLSLPIVLTFICAFTGMAQKQTPAIEVTTDNESAQFAVQGQAQTVHVEVFSPAGELVFETDSAVGQAADWRMVNDRGEHVADGVYVATITMTDFSGKRRKRIEQIIVNSATQAKAVLSANASITPAAVGSINSDASMQAVSFSGNSVSPLLSGWNTRRGAQASVRGAIHTAAQYNIGGPRVFGVEGPSNTFYGHAAGAHTIGTNNSFFGSDAGQQNDSGSNNSFFGMEAGKGNRGGNSNSFFGSDAGTYNYFGSENSFFGMNAGFNNTEASRNSFFGMNAGLHTERGGQNSFFGQSAGQANLEGEGNSFFGQSAGVSNTAGSRNTFVGLRAGSSNIRGNDNTFIGNNADGSAVGKNLDGSPRTNNFDPLHNATAVGANAIVTQSDSLVLGSSRGFNGATADTKVGIGTSAPKAELDVEVGDLLVGSAGRGVILKSPDGSRCARLTINNSGVLLTSAFACP